MTAHHPSRMFLLGGAIYGLLAVSLGAFGAHALRDRLAPEMLAVYHTGVEYQFYHALALLLVGLWNQWQPSQDLKRAGYCWVLGVAVFSGSLYAYTLTGVRQLGMITPLGGVSMLAGWICLIRAAVRLKNQ